MSELETKQDSQPSPEEQRLAEILGFRPELPSGAADISDIEGLADSQEATEAGYAWERLPLWLAKVGETYKETEGAPIVTLDLGSSLPLYAQLLRALEFRRCRERAGELVKELCTEESLSKLRSKKGHLKALHKVASRDKSGRELLATAVGECLYEITPEESQNTDDARLAFRKRLLEKIVAIDYTYELDDSVKNIETGWQLRIDREDRGTTYFEHLESLRVPTPEAVHAGLRMVAARESRGITYINQAARLEEQKLAQQKQPAGQGVVSEYVLWQSDELAKKVVGNKRYKPARFLSADVSEPVEIAKSSVKNTPDATKSLNIFTHAVSSLSEPNQHMRLNMFEPLPLPDNSISLITCFDSWPLHFQRDPEIHDDDKDFGEIAIKMLQGLYEKLTYGGKIVVFPWRTDRESHSDVKADNLVLDGVMWGLSENLGHSIGRNSLHKKVLVSDLMSDSDREVSDRMSPMIDDRYEGLTALVITKPSKASMRSRAKNAQEASVQTPAQDSLNPTQ